MSPEKKKGDRALVIRNHNPGNNADHQARHHKLAKQAKTIALITNQQMNSKVKKTDVESGDSSSSYGSLGGSLNRDSDTESTSKTFLERQRKDITYIAEKKTFWKGVVS